MLEKFDFSKIEDQKKFDKLSAGKKNQEISDAQAEALAISELIKQGKVQSYQEAERMVDEIKDRLIKALKRADVQETAEIINKFSLSPEVLSSDEFQTAAEIGFFHCIKFGQIDDAIKIIKQFALPQEVIQAVAKEGSVSRLESGDIDNAKKIIKQFALPMEVIKAAAKEKVVSCLEMRDLEMRDIDDAKKIIEQFALPPEVVQDATKVVLVYCLENGNIDNAKKIIEQLALPPEVLSTVEVQTAAKGKLVNCIKNNQNNNAKIIIEQFALPPEVVQTAAKEMVVNCLINGHINYVKNFIEQFALPPEVVQTAAKEVLVYSLRRLNIDNAKIIIEQFALPSEVVQTAAKEGVVERLRDCDIDSAITIKNEFNLAITVSELTQALPALGDFLSVLREKSPGFYEQACRSTEILFSLTEFSGRQDELIRQIEANPFLLEAVAGNPRYGAKLLIKFPSFDESAQNNIKELHKNKAEIIKENPEIDPQSNEFRILMQEKLKNYENNKITINAINKKSVNAEFWLDHDEVAYFNLDTGGEQLDFSEAITTPIKRIKETIEQYAYTVKSVLKEYRKELTDFQIPAEDTSPIEEQIEKMEEELEKALAAGNDKKAEGISRGIEGLRQKIAGVKTMPLWEKLTGQIDGFNRLKDDLFTTQGKLIQADKDLMEKLSGKQPSGKLIQELKQKINAAKEELRTKLKTLELRIENFKDNLSAYLEAALTKDRADALIQEIELKLAEQFNHYDTDRGTLSNIFADNQRERSDRDRMENQPMSVFVWARNPDVDLYQGNYSPCCICIESDFHGAESPIADYATDLGIQIVNIWDETKNEPVAAAWCFLGEDENGEPALVIDNIEANTTYSANFSEQLTSELFDYVKNYAASIGVHKVVLGKANNDLPTAGELAKLPEASSRYNKIGAYNRPDGYFLEAEEKSVKLVWERPEKRKKAAKGKQEQVERTKRIKFESIKISDLSEKDFEIIKKLEKRIYEADGLVQGEELITELKEGNGLSYSVIVRGSRPDKKANEAVGYIIAVEDETDEGDPSIYLEDIALVPEAQGQQLGWEMLKQTIKKLKAKAARDGKPMLFDMHLRENSQRFMERYHNDLEQMGVKLIESVLIPDYYEDGNDALYKVYQVEA